MLASLPKLKKQNTLQTVRSFCEFAKKFDISTLFQNVYLGWKLSQIINKQRGGAGEDVGSGVRNKNVLGGQNRKIN